MLAAVAHEFRPQTHLADESLTLSGALFASIPLLPRKGLLESPVIAEDTQLQMGLEQAKFGRLPRVELRPAVGITTGPGKLTHLRAHVAVENTGRPVVLFLLLGRQRQLSCTLNMAWELQYVLGSTQTQRVVEKNQPVTSNRLALLKWYADEAAKLRETVEGVGS